MHDDPIGPDPKQQGSVAVRGVLNLAKPPLAIRGHAHWDDPLIELEAGTQVLNVDCRIVVMIPS